MIVEVAVEVSLVTWNAHWGVSPRTWRPFDVVSVLAAIEADVLVLQEVFWPDVGVGWVDRAAERLGMRVLSVPLERAEVSDRHRVVVEPRSRVRTRWGGRIERFRIADLFRVGEGRTCGWWGLAVLSRRPLHLVEELELPTIIGDPVRRRVPLVAVDVGGGQLLVAATHLSHWPTHALVQLVRLRSLLAGRPVVVAGDLNLWPSAVRSVFRGFHLAEAGPTWPSSRPLVQTDHVVSPEGWAVRHAETLAVGGSDHVPLRVTLCSIRDRRLR